jgi:hypothetical protein
MRDDFVGRLPRSANASSWKTETYALRCGLIRSMRSSTERDKFIWGEIPPRHETSCPIQRR